MGAGFEGQESVFLSLKLRFGAGEGGVCASTAAWGSLIRYRTERAPACTVDPARGRALAGAHRLPDPGFTQLVSLFFTDGHLSYVVY